MPPKFLVLILLAWVLAATPLSAQMWNGADSLAGNEWIDYNKTYFKINVAADGLYRIAAGTLQAAGFPLGATPASQFRLLHEGREVPLFTSTSGLFGAQDYFEFFGRRNRGALDRHLFADAEWQMVNPLYSLVNDTAAYYLTWSADGTGQRFSVQPNNLANAPAPEPYVWATSEQSYADAHFKRDISYEIRYSWYNGDGFGTVEATQTDRTVELAHAAPGGAPDATVTVRYAVNRGSHQQELWINDELQTTHTVNGFAIFNDSVSVPAGGTGGGPLKVSVRGVADPNDRHVVGSVVVRYPRLPAFDGDGYATFGLEAAPGVPRYLELSGFDASPGVPVLFDLTNLLRIEGIVQGGVVKFVLPPSSAARTLAVVQPGSAAQGTAVQPGRQFRNFPAENADYVIISHRKFIAGPSSPVQAYADYRASVAGGGYQSTVIDVEELYEQFAYGVRFHPLAIRNFAWYITRTWTAPKYVLLIGKGRDYNTFRAPDVQAQLADSLFFLPNYGSPGTDLLYVMPGHGIARPRLGIGRLAVTAPVEISWYLDKVIEHENLLATSAQTIADKLWLKRALHISGGLAGEQQAIAAYVNSLSEEIRNNALGADVTTLYKTTNDPIQQTAYEQVLQSVREGVSLWMIFGHSSPVVVDFDIGTVDEHDNQGRYPLMMIMGCNSGVCSLDEKGLGEKFVLAPDKGALAYFATVYYSFIDGLHGFGREFYQHMGGDNYGQSLGEIINNTIGSFGPTNYPSLIAVLHQYQLQGDPALHLHRNTGPDYTPDRATLTVAPNPVPVEQGAFQARFDVVNLGKNTANPLAVKIEQRLPDNTVRLLRTDTIAAPALRQTLQYNLPATGTPAGYSRLLVTLDPANMVDETPAPAAESNNELTDHSGETGVDVYFYNDDVQPVFPRDFAIVGQGPVPLFASTLSLRNDQPRGYLFEIDTSERFDSPLRQTTQLMQPGGLLTWQPTVPLFDHTVYYWRVARDSLSNGQVAWKNRSFLYLAGSPSGWNQSDYGQYRQDSAYNIQFIDSTREVAFANDLSNILVKVGYWNGTQSPGVTNTFFEGITSNYWWGVVNIYRGVVVMVLNPNNGHAVVNDPDSLYNSVPGVSQYFFWFDTQDSLHRLALMDFIENKVESGQIVGLVTVNLADDPVAYAPNAWAADSVTYGKNLFQVLEAQGAARVRQLANGASPPPAYGLIFRKNDPGFGARDTIVATALGTATMRHDFYAKWTSGEMETPPIGPAVAWKRVQWHPSKKDHPLEEVSVDLLGVRPGQPDTVLARYDLGVDTPLTLSATSFPYLKFRYHALDTILHTPNLPHYLRVLYDGLPEGALHPAAHSTFYRDTLDRGEQLRASVAFANIADQPLDSVLVRFRLENAQGAGAAAVQRFRPLAPGDTLHARASFDTRTLSGTYRWSVDVNPDQDQPEQFHFNNIAFRDVYVRPDDRNPLLDVTFDGAHILNGDIVSPRPFIVVTLKDDNRFLALTDTALFRLVLVRPGGQASTVYFADPAVQFFPADAGQLPKKNLARIEWQPQFAQDGDYELRVQGRDASGNASGQLEFTVRFTVVNRSSISNVLNYPNPFSTSTCFVYTMTGSETPGDFRIQIMTVSGRVVREITAGEFGPLRAGTHRSDFCWDGRDQYGDQLANGVYLYRVVAKKADGSAFEFFDNNAIDGYFKKGFGKMVLIR